MLLAKNTFLQNNRYLIVDYIAQGGFGVVYEVEDQRLRRTVALKQLTLVSAQHSLRAFKREARILANLKHSGLPDVSDYFIEDGNQFLVMEYIPGDDLEKELETRGQPFDMTEVLEWADQLLDILEYLHEKQQPPIIHRDIKPDNIKLSSRRKVILLDFGISKGGQIYSGPLSTSNLTPKAPSLHAFTPPYAPPEQIYHLGTDERSDLYALGATLYHLLTNKTPVSARSREKGGGKGI